MREKGNFKRVGKKVLGLGVGGQGWSGHQKHRYFFLGLSNEYKMTPLSDVAAVNLYLSCDM